MDQVTGDDGIARFDLAPQSKVSVSIEVEEEFDADNNTATMDLSAQPEQFLGFQLERRCFVDIKCVHCETMEGLEGFIVKVYDVTDQVRGDKLPTKVGRRFIFHPVFSSPSPHASASVTYSPPPALCV